MPVFIKQQTFHFLIGPVVGEFPCQNDINLSQAPALPQVRNANILLGCMVRDFLLKRSLFIRKQDERFQAPRCLSL